MADSLRAGGGGRLAEAARVGLIWGLIALFFAIVGMVEAFAGRQIVVGVVSLGVALVAVTGLSAGYRASRWQKGSPIGPPLLRGAVAGAASGLVVSLLVVAGTGVNLRAMFVSASPELFGILSMGRGMAGAYIPTVGGAVLGLAGAAVSILASPRLRPLATGLAAVLAVGVFQELLQLLLAEGAVQSAVRALLFESEGLSPRGAAVVLAVGWTLAAVWRRRREGARDWYLTQGASRQRSIRLVAYLMIIAGVIVLPHFAGLFLSQVLVLVGLFALLGLGLNVVVGFAGLLDLGYVAFFAIGAYAVGLLTSVGEHGLLHLSFWVAAPIAMVVSLIAGVLLGIPVLRIRGDYLAIATLGFGEIIRVLVLSDFLRPWLGGSQGVLAIPRPMILGYEFAGPEQLFYLVVASCALVVVVAGRLRDSRLGRAWMAVREDEDVAEAMGINLVNIKLLAFGIGATFGGISGAIFAVMLGSVFPHSFQLLISINALALIIVGGMGSMPGVIVGSLVLVGLPELLREFAEFRFLVYGAALVVMMQVRPEGLWPAAALRRELHEANHVPGLLAPDGDGTGQQGAGA